MKFRTMKDEIESMSTSKLKRLLVSPGQVDLEWETKIKDELSQREQEDNDEENSWFL
jgi:hypothetical protein